MSVVPEVSVKGRFAARRRELQSKTVLDPLAVPGYDGLYARYRILGYEDMREIGLRNEEEAPSIAEGEKWTAADTLVDACVDLMEPIGKDDEGRLIFQSLSYRWTAQAARDLFETEVPEDATGREALLSVFPYPQDMLLMTHFQEYVTDANLAGINDLEPRLMGESRAASEPT